MKAVNEFSDIKHIIGIVSGKGGVGKSFVTASLAVELAKLGFEVGILDADITGPSIPHMFNINEGVYGDEKAIFPAKSAHLGIKVISSALLLKENNDPIMWRGPLIGDLVTQFYTSVAWGQLDFLLIDFPPGTSDVALNAFDNVPIESLILVTTPQQMVLNIVGKIKKMAIELDVKMLGVVENMAYINLEDGKKYYLFGKTTAEEIKDKLGLELLASISLQQSNTKFADESKIEFSDTSEFNGLASLLSEEKENE